MTDSWTTNSNGAVCLRMVGAPPARNSIFHPDFTYPIYGEEESIYGYQDLSLNLGFVSGSLQPLLQLTYGRKVAGSAAKIDLPDSKLLECFNKGEVLRCSSRADMDVKAQKSSSGFEPIGEKVGTWTVPSSEFKGKQKSVRGSASRTPTAEPEGDHHYEVYLCTWDTPRFKQFYRRMRIFTYFFIEAGTFLDEDEPNWEFFLLFERDSDSKVHFVGFTSLYRFWTYPDSSRVRLSQFLILPPYQGFGLGTRLYLSVHDQMLKRGDKVAELTVEDPSEAFDRMRDSADLRRLLNPNGLPESSIKITSFSEGMKGGKLGPPVDAEWSEEQRRLFKIPPRQWSRLVEMIQLMHIDPSEEEQVKAYRLQVKARIHKQNRDKLSQVSRADRIKTLHERYEDIVANEYGELVGVDVSPLLGGVELPEDEEEDAADASGSHPKKGKGGRPSNGNERPNKVARLG